jgi:Zn-dependent protease with chaperone function
VTTIVLDILLGFVAAIIVAWFSRQREFRADAGAAQLMGRKQPMMNALARLGGMVPGELPKSIRPWGSPAISASCSPATRRLKSALLRCKTAPSKPLAACGRAPPEQAGSNNSSEVFTLALRPR